MLSSQIRSSANRALLEEFIASYRSEPCLWQIKNRDYYNREKRNASLDRLLKKLRKLEPAAEREDVMRKINSIRTTYNKERRKVLEAEAEGGVRVPKLWCYGLLAFLDDKSVPQRGPGAGSKREPVAAEPQEEEIEELDEHILEMEFKEHCEESGENNDTVEHTTLSYEDQSDSEDDLIRVPRAKIRKTDFSVAPNAVQSADSYAKGSREDAHSEEVPTRDHRPVDRHDIYCKSIACKLRDLPKHQRLLAEHLMNEVLFEAEWGNLTLKHRLAQ